MRVISSRETGQQKKRSTNVASIFCCRYCRTVLLFERRKFDIYEFTYVGRRESVNWLEGEKQDLKLDTFIDKQAVKLSQCWSFMTELLRSRAWRAAAFCNLCNFEI